MTIILIMKVFGWIIFGILVLGVLEEVFSSWNKRR